jgi:hypothetical protein
MVRTLSAVLYALSDTAATAHAAGSTLKGTVVLKGKAPAPKEVNM